MTGSVCAACGTVNRLDRKFCAGCGAALPLNCPACGAGNETGERFCGECGSPLAAPAPAPAPVPAPSPLAELEGERKQVTVLFADVSGSMDLAEDLDPEAWAQIMDRFFAILAEGVRRYGGHRRQVHRRRDHGSLRRARRPGGPCPSGRPCRPDLIGAVGRLRRRAATQHGLDFHVRVGLNSGEVVVGAARRRRPTRVHRRGPHGRAGPADGGPGRARLRLPQRAHGPTRVRPVPPP